MLGEGATDGISLGFREGPFTPENKSMHLLARESFFE